MAPLATLFDPYSWGKESYYDSLGEFEPIWLHWPHYLILIPGGKNPTIDSLGEFDPIWLHWPHYLILIPGGKNSTMIV